MKDALFVAGSFWLLVFVVSAVQAALAQAGDALAPRLPDDWLAKWKQPPAEDRPLQIVHGIDPKGAARDGMAQMVPTSDPQQIAQAGMQFYKGLGLGGIVCNVDFKDYMRSEESFKVLVNGVEACKSAGLVVWLYDEEGYPSGAAGGLVLKDNPAFEASELVFDAAGADPFTVRPAYEHTHASNNYHAARRYANLLDDRATRSFIAHTHDVYWKRLEPHFGTTIQAMFTDEPSLIAVNLGQIPEDVRKKVRVVDPLDPAVKPLPAIPWSYDIVEQYRKRWGEDLTAQRRSLFAGDTPDDRKVRRQFWSLVADLVAERYFGAIQDWCGKHRVASSGHILWEEALLHHPALDGNHLKALSRMDIPGLDMLSSNPEAVIHDGWLTAALPSSAALLTGRRRVMTEISDFSEKMGGRGPATLADMQAAAAWQAAWGVTDFTLYYGIRDRSAEDYRAYCEFVGRLNAILKPARFAPDVLLYYPVCDVWPEYKPVAEPLRLESQSPRARTVVNSFRRLGQTLQRRQIPFALADHEFLAGAAVIPPLTKGGMKGGCGALSVKDRRFRALVLPQDVELPAATARVVDEFRAKGGCVVADGPAPLSLAPAAIVESLKPAHAIAPASDRIAVGQFVRDGRQVLLVVNVGTQAYAGQMAAEAADTWQALDPATGAVQPAPSDGANRIRLALSARQAVLLIGK